MTLRQIIRRVPTALTLAVCVDLIGTAAYSIFNSYGSAEIFDQSIVFAWSSRALLALPFLALGGLGFIAPDRIRRIRGVLPIFIVCVAAVRGVTVTHLSQLAFGLRYALPYLAIGAIALIACLPREVWADPPGNAV